MTLRVAIVVDRFPHEPFLAQQVAALSRRSVDVHILCQIADPESLAWSHLTEVDLDGRIHPWPNHGRYPALSLAVARELMRAIIGLRFRIPRALFSAVRAEVRSRERPKRNIVGRLLFDLRVLAIDPDVVHFEFGDLARSRTHLAPAVDAAFTSSFRGYDLAYAGIEDPGFYDRLWPVLDGAHTLGQDLLKIAQRRGAPRSVQWALIPPAIDVAHFDLPDRTGRDEPKDEDLRLVSVGRLHWKKGLPDGLVAVSQLVAQGRSVRYRIVGAGPAEEQVRWTINDLGLDNVVTLVGECDPSRVRDHLAWADILIHPALSEGFGNAVIEAQASGLPVVCTDAEGLAENIEDGVTGLVVPRRRPDLLAAALRELADQPHRRQTMGHAGRRRAVEKFGLDDQTDAYLDFFAAAIEAKAARRQR